MKSTLCIIPARQGSKGLKNKNIKLLANIPLIKYPYIIAKKLNFLEDIVISSDSKKYLKIIKDKKVIKILRPKKLSSSKSRIIDVIKHTLNNLKKNYEYILILEPTSPLTDYREVNKAFKNLLIKKKDFIISVVSLEKYHPELALSLDKKMRVKNKKFPKSNNRQTLSKKFFISGNFYIAKTKKLLSNKSWISSNTLGFKIKTSIHTDIDSYNDFLFAQTILKNGSFKKIK